MDRPNEKGTSLVEVVIALLILLILMIAILQMFSMAYLSNMNAGATTDLVYKSQLTAEIVRWGLFQQAYGRTVDGMPTDALTLGSHNLPASSSDSGWTFWGPGKLAVVEREGAPYEVQYDIADGVSTWNVTVQARPRVTGTGRYTGVALRGKVVEYALQVPKNAP